MTVIKGTIIDATGQPLAGATITLTAIQTTAGMLRSIATYITTVRGEYVFTVTPGVYSVSLTQGSRSYVLGAVQIYDDSPDGTLNSFLNAKNTDTRPEALKQFEALMQQAKDSAAQAAQNSAGVQSAAEQAATSEENATGAAQTAATAAEMATKAARQTQSDVQSTRQNVNTTQDNAAQAEQSARSADASAKAAADSEHSAAESERKSTESARAASQSQTESANNAGKALSSQQAAESSATAAEESKNAAALSEQDASSAAQTATEKAREATASGEDASRSAKESADSATAAEQSNQQADLHASDARQALKEAQEIAKTPGPSAYDVWVSQQPQGTDTTMDAYLTYQKGRGLEKVYVKPPLRGYGTAISPLDLGADSNAIEVGDWIMAWVNDPLTDKGGWMSNGSTIQGSRLVQASLGPDSVDSSGKPVQSSSFKLFKKNSTPPGSYKPKCDIQGWGLGIFRRCY